MKRSFVGRLLCILLLVSTLSGCKLFNSDGDSDWALGNLLSGEPSREKNLQSRLDDDEYDVFGERDPDRLMFSDFSPGRIGTTLQSHFGGGEDQAAAERSFAEAKQIYQGAVTRRDGVGINDDLKADFRRAAKKFQVAAAKWPDSAIEHDALFLQGESHFFADQYVLANRAYEILIRRYSGTRHLDLVESRRFEIAQYWLKLHRNQSDYSLGVAVGDSKRPVNDLAGQARRILHRIRLDDPTGKLADDATMALANAFFEAKRYSDAADTYEDLRKTFPGSPHQFNAHLFELRSRLTAYRGSSYDGTDLVKADELMRNLLRQFPDESRQHKDYLIREGTKVRNLLADRDLTLADFYKKRGENRAATYYYTQVAENYDDTSLAEQARGEIADLNGKPPVPKQYGKFIADLFPVKEVNKPLIASGDNETVFK